YGNRYLYFRNTEHRDSPELNQRWDQALGWSNYSRVKKIYDATGKLINTSKENWINNNSWQISDTVEYTYYPNDSLYMVKHFNQGSNIVNRFDSLVYSGD